MKAILIDVTKCTGCERCVDACKASHGLGPDIPARKLSDDGLSSRRLCSLISLPGRRFAKKQCVHCLKPGCVDACPVGAIRKTSEGPVVYDPGRCMGCRYCMIACPLDIPRYEWEKPLPYMQKCDMCFERIREEGQQPACVEACPEKACLFGDRKRLLREAERRLARNPGVYVQHIYGQEELGGTSVLYISDTPLDALGWPENVGERTMHSYTWPVISKTPLLAATVGGFLIGTYAVIQRRMRLESQRADRENAEEPETVDIEKDEDGAE
jgi:formate dehydrogenase iron-sulfur subunit